MVDVRFSKISHLVPNSGIRWHCGSEFNGLHTIKNGVVFTLDLYACSPSGEKCFASHTFESVLLLTMSGSPPVKVSLG